MRKLLSFLMLLSFLTFGVAARAVEGPGWSSATKTFRGGSFRVVTLDLNKIDLKLHWRKADGTQYSSLAAVREAVTAGAAGSPGTAGGGPRFVMAANSGIYSQQYAPIGLHVERRKQLKPVNKSEAPGGNFSMVPNGIFAITKTGAQVLETKEYLQTAAKQPEFIVEEASQSGPLLVNRGKLHPKFQEGSPNAKLRNGVGVDKKGRVVFAISDGLVNFYDFALLFRDALDCPSALYLDGTISKMIIGSDTGEDQLVPFAGIWAATEKR